MTKTIAILGSTGSIGRQTLDVVDGEIRYVTDKLFDYPIEYEFLLPEINK